MLPALTQHILSKCRPNKDYATVPRTLPHQRAMVENYTEETLPHHRTE